MARTFKDGNIKRGCFSEGRIFGFPSGVGVLLIMFNQWLLDKDTHEEIENGYDNVLSQIGRLITGGSYVCTIALKDYVRTILNHNRTDNK